MFLVSQGVTLPHTFWPKMVHKNWYFLLQITDITFVIYNTFCNTFALWPPTLEKKIHFYELCPAWLRSCTSHFINQLTIVEPEVIRSRRCTGG